VELKLINWIGYNLPVGPVLVLFYLLKSITPITGPETFRPVNNLDARLKLNFGYFWYMAEIMVKALAAKATRYS